MTSKKLLTVFLCYFVFAVCVHAFPNYSHDYLTLEISLDTGYSKASVNSFNPQYLVVNSSMSLFASGFFFGAIVLIGLYNFVLFFLTKERTHLYYVFYIAFTGLYVGTLNGLFISLWPVLNKVESHLVFFSLLAVIGFYYRYVTSFVYIKCKDNRLYITLYVLYAVVASHEHLIFGTQYYNLAVVIFLVSIIYRSLKKVRSEQDSSVWLVIFGTFLLTVGIALNNTLFLVGDGGTVFSTQFFNSCVILELLLFSFALGQKIKSSKEYKEVVEYFDLEIEKEELSEEDLKARVKEKVEHLKRSNKLIKDESDALIKSNEELQRSVMETKREKLLHTPVSLDDFTLAFPDNRACFEYLSMLKWKDTSHSCLKCGNVKYSKGRAEFSRKCTKCGYDETPIMNTLFSNVKFPISKAMAILYILVNSKEKVTSTQISELLDMRQKTAWSFMKKTKERIAIVHERQVAPDKRLTWVDYILNPKEE